MEMTLRLPSTYVSIEREEMEYVDGGMEWYYKAAVFAGIAVLGVGLVVAFAYGQLYLAAKIMGLTFQAVVRKAGFVGVSAAIVSSGIATKYCVDKVLHLCGL